MTHACGWSEHLRRRMWRSRKKKRCAKWIVATTMKKKRISRTKWKEDKHTMTMVPNYIKRNGK